MYRLFLALLVLTTMACSPKTTTKAYESSMPSRAGLDYEPFAIIEQDTLDWEGDQLEAIGHIAIKDSGFSVKCDYDTVKRLAKKEALKLGGNCILITKHTEPDNWSTCHRINAVVLFIDDAKAYEKEIVWHKNRKLEISDFKGSTAKRPFTAETASTFRANVEYRPINKHRYDLMVETVFNTEISYFKHTDREVEVLAHEQIHFDIAELYARKYVKRMEKEAKDINQYLGKSNAILGEIWAALKLKQDEYDTEVYADRSLQPKWANWIKGELIKTEPYASKSLSVRKDGSVDLDE